ncbi:MAG: flavin oxidoreductase/NADH oxidase [Bacillota bacterium]
MAAHGRFRYRTIEALQTAIHELGVDIPLQEDLSPLSRPVQIGHLVAPNSLAIHPMEGCDGQDDGSPSELTRRRYLRFAAGGAGLLWFEATAVVPEGRANERQLWIRPENVDSFASMLQEAHAVAEERPVTVLQLTHSGRYSKPGPPVIAYHHPYLPAGVSDGSMRVITDEEIEALEDRYVDAARLAFQAGFDAVDVKHCHRYLGSELLSAFTRPGRYGGSYENRTRFLKNIIRKIQAAVPGLVVTTRLNAYDAIPYPYGWGVSQENHLVPDLSEPKRLLRELHEMGVPMVNVSLGNPYYNPHIGRPFDDPIIGAYLPDEHPLVGVSRALGIAAELQRAVPAMVIVGTGYSWLRQHLGQVGAASIAQGRVTIVGVGREGFAHPNFARELLGKGELDFRQVCITCSKCTQIMRDNGTTGCVPHDKEIYQAIYDAGRAGKPKPEGRPVVRAHL